VLVASTRPFTKELAFFSAARWSLPAQGRPFPSCFRVNGSAGNEAVIVDGTSLVANAAGEVLLRKPRRGFVGTVDRRDSRPPLRGPVTTSTRAGRSWCGAFAITPKERVFRAPVYRTIGGKRFGGGSRALPARLGGANTSYIVMIPSLFVEGISRGCSPGAGPQYGEVRSSNRSAQRAFDVIPTVGTPNAATTGGDSVLAPRTCIEASALILMSSRREARCCLRPATIRTAAVVTANALRG